MLAKIKSCAINGIDASPVEVEVFVKGGAWEFIIIGLGDSAVRESRDRVTSAIQQSGFELPDRILVNLAPAEMKKEGSSFDLPIAVGILAASGQVNAARLTEVSLHGELALDGRIKPVRGALSFTIEALSSGSAEVILPAENYAETALLSGARVVGVSSLTELVLYLNGQKSPQPPPQLDRSFKPGGKLVSEVWGQHIAKRALLIAAAGGHNILMIGPPGCGKTMLAERFSSLLPAMTNEEMLEVVRIHGIAGSPMAELLTGARPFRAPHHVVSDAGLIGGGSVPKPGEISLAHRGVLFLDEFPEFRRSALEALRSPLETGAVRITRTKGSVLFPANFQLIAAMNPCPCGRLGMTAGKGQTACLCSRPAIHGYLRKLSQPILDRIDLHVELEAVPFQALLGRVEQNLEKSECLLREKVLQARKLQVKGAGTLNSRLPSGELGKRVKIKPGVSELLELAAKKTGLSARSYVRVLRVATTICDLDGIPEVGREQVAEALSFRGLERIQAYVRGAAAG